MKSEIITLLSAVDLTADNDGNSTPVDIGEWPITWIAHIACAVVSGNSPTLDAKIQHSIDGTNWVDLVAFTQITTSTANEHKFAAAATDYLKPLGRYIRAVTTVGGTSTPTFNDTTIKVYVKG